MHKDVFDSCFNLGVSTAVVIMRTHAIELLNRMGELDTLSNEWRELWKAYEELSACADAVGKEMQGEG